MHSLAHQISILQQQDKQLMQSIRDLDELMYEEKEFRFQHEYAKENCIKLRNLIRLKLIQKNNNKNN